MLSADSMTVLLLKIVDIEPGLLELFESETGVRFFFGDTVYNVCGRLRACVVASRRSPESAWPHVTQSRAFGSAHRQDNMSRQARLDGVS